MGRISRAKSTLVSAAERETGSEENSTGSRMRTGANQRNEEEEPKSFPSFCTVCSRQFMLPIFRPLLSVTWRITNRFIVPLASLQFLHLVWRSGDAHTYTNRPGLRMFFGSNFCFTPD